MSRPARRRELKLDVVDQTLGNPEFVESIERCLVSAADKVYEADNPYYIPAFVGQNMYFNTAHFASQELRSLGFKLTYEQNQLRVRSETYFAKPVTITFWSGSLVNGIVTSKWPRGMATKQLVLLNQVSHQPLQPSLFQTQLSNDNVLQELHLGVVHAVKPSSLRAWLVVAVKWLDPKTLECAEWKKVCHREGDRQSIPDIAPVTSDDSDYFIDFGESLTGT